MWSEEEEEVDTWEQVCLKFVVSVSGICKLLESLDFEASRTLIQQNEIRRSARSHLNEASKKSKGAALSSPARFLHEHKWKNTRFAELARSHNLTRGRSFALRRGERRNTKLNGRPNINGVSAGGASRVVPNFDQFRQNLIAAFETEAIAFPHRIRRFPHRIRLS
jgi:hypothetical protein